MDNDVTSEPQLYAVTITALVMSDSYMELRKRVTVMQGEIRKVMKSNPNSDGFYMAVDDVWANVKPPISVTKDDSEGELISEGDV